MSNAYTVMRQELYKNAHNNPYYERSHKQFLRYLKAVSNK